VKTYGEWRCSRITFLTLALDRGEWSASHPGHFTPEEGAPSTHWIGGWVGPRASLDTVKKRKTLAPAMNQIQIPQLSSLSPVAILTELSQLLESR
jgi:hypothetical protein